MIGSGFKFQVPKLDGLMGSGIEQKPQKGQMTEENTIEENVSLSNSNSEGKNEEDSDDDDDDDDDSMTPPPSSPPIKPTPAGPKRKYNPF